MAADFDHVIRMILAHEGGFVDDPDDPGGVTNWGITLGWLRQFEPDANRDTIVHMTREEAASRYRTYIWDKLGYGLLTSTGVAAEVMDTAVNFGEPRGHRFAQQAANDLGKVAAEGWWRAEPPLVVDGNLGPKSYTALNACDPKALVARMVEYERERYHGIVAKRPTSSKFLKAWLRRANCTVWEPCKNCRYEGVEPLDA